MGSKEGDPQNRRRSYQKGSVRRKWEPVGVVVYPEGMSRRNGLNRVLDANANRAREGVRVMEDAARFILDDAPIASELKGLRHAITSHSSELLGGMTSPARDAAGDVGTREDLPSECSRPNLVSVVEAAGHRAAEALRALEEFAKVIDVGHALAFEQIRYRIYDLERSLVSSLARSSPATWRVQVSLTESSCLRPWSDVLDAIVAGGADAIQIREKTLSDVELIARVREVIAVARPAGVAVIVNDRLDVAVAAGAEGVHLGQDDFPVEEARGVIGSSMILGGSAHTLHEAERNFNAGCDYCGLGRMFSSETKPGVHEAGPRFLRECVDLWPTWPHLAIGGVAPEGIDTLIEHGASGVAVCHAVCGSENPEEVVSTLRLALEHESNRHTGSLHS